MHQFSHHAGFYGQAFKETQIRMNVFTSGCDVHDTARTWFIFKYTTFIKDIQGTEFSRVWVFVPNYMNMRLYRMGKN